MTTAEPTRDAADVVMRNVAELAQRQQARELGSSLARHVFRLLKVAQFHALDNMAFLQQLDQTIDALAAFGAQTGEPLSLLFTKTTVFVSGQLLKASRAEYEAALELGRMVRKLGVTQLTIQTDAGRTDLKALARLFQPGTNVKAEGGVLEPSSRVRLRYVRAARLDENEAELTPEEQVLRTYATAVVVMRRVYENLAEGRYLLPNQVKRLAQRLVVLSEGDTPAFLGVTGMRNLNHDAAGRAVNRAILAVAMGRGLSRDLATLSRIAMSALFFDVATPLVTGSVGMGKDVVVAHMTDEAERRLPAATAVVLTALGHVREASMVRTVVAFEAHWLRQSVALGPLYDGEHRPMVAARIVATAQRFNQLMEPDLAASTTMSVDDALAKMRVEAREALDQAMLALLIGALGVYPRGAPVELSTGERAVVLQTPANPADYPRPTVRLVYDRAGQPLRSKITLDLAQDPERQVTGVITDPDPLLRQISANVAAAAAPPAVPHREEEAELDLDAPVSAPPLSPAPITAPPISPPPVSAPPTSAPPVTPRVDVRGEMPTLTPPSNRTAPPRSARPSMVEIEEAPHSRRDPRSDDYEPEPGAVAAPVQPLSRRPGSSPLASDPMREASVEVALVEPSEPSFNWRRHAAALPPAERAPQRGQFARDVAPSASGALERTPFSHLLLYILERGLGGSLVLTPPEDPTGEEAEEHAVHFRDGIPAKAHVAARVAPLGPLLVAHGLLEQSQLESDPITQPPTREATLEGELIELGLLRAPQLASVRNEQLAERLCFLFGLPPATRYAFYNGVDLLTDVWGEVSGTVSPRAILSQGLREHPETEAMDRVLSKLSSGPLKLGDGTLVDEFEFSEDEIGVVLAFAMGTPSLGELLEGGHDPEVVRRVIYELVLAHAVVPV